MARKPPQTYNVVRSQDGALVIRDVSLKMARSECARLCAGAAVTDPATGKPVGLFLGEVVRYEVRSPEGLTIA